MTPRPVGALLLSGLLGITLEQLLLTPWGLRPSPAWLLAVAAPALFLGGYRPATARWSWSLAALCLGIAWSAWRAPPPPDWFTRLGGVDQRIEGVVAGLPQPREHGLRFPFHVSDAETGDFPQRLLLDWYGRPPELQPGERYRLTVRLRPLPDAWQRRGFHARGYVVNDAPYSASGESHGLHALRQRLSDDIEHHLDGHPAAGVILALALGIRHGLDDHAWHVLLATGTNHLVAISGLHVGLVAGLTLWLASRVWRWSGLSGWIAAPRAATVIALLAALGYSALAGFSIPTQRALIMLTVALGAPLLGRHPPPGRILLLAAAAVALWDPRAVGDPGAWLSFAAVAILIYGLHGRPTRHTQRFRWLHDWGRTQWLLTVGLLPLLIGLFGQVSWIAPLANLVAVPWTGLVVVPLTLAGTAALGLEWQGLGAALIRGAAESWSLLWPLLELAARWGALHLPTPPAWAWAAALPAVLWLLAPRGLPVRWLGLLWLAPLAAAPLPRPEHGAFHFTLWDAGAGLAAVVETRNHLLVYDSGSTGHGRELARTLSRRGWRTIDTLILSHDDARHTGGARPLVTALPAATVIVGEPGAWSGRSRPCRDGESWQWDGVRFRLHHPHPEARGDDAACILEVGGGRLLLTADLRRPGSLPAATGTIEVLVVPAHGSPRGADLSLLKPRWALAATAAGNPRHPPWSETESRYRRHGARWLDTARHGRLTFHFPAHGPARLQSGTAFAPAPAHELE